MLSGVTRKKGSEVLLNSLLMCVYKTFLRKLDHSRGDDCIVLIDGLIVC